MITRAELDEYQSLLDERDDLKERLEHKESQLYTIKNQKYTAVLGGHGDVDKIGAAIAEVEELREYYYAKVVECERKLKRIETELDRLDGIERQIMRYRYIDGLWWKSICIKVNYEWAQIHRLHKQILAKLSKDDTP